jgi:small conductance mechanosensitive channel
VSSLSDEKAGILIEHILITAAIIILGLLVIKFATMFTRRFLQKTSLDESAYKFVVNVMRVVLYAILIVVVFKYLRISTTPIVALLGGAGAAIALSLKDSIGNIAGGLLILANKPFKKGDVIDVAGVEGRVESIDLFVITLKTFDNKTVTVPNGTVTTSVLTNYSREKKRRVDCSFGISYDSDIKVAKEILARVSSQCPDVLKTPPTVIGVSDLADSAVMLDLKAWCNTAKYNDVKYFLEEQVKLAFDEAGITIPYPCLDVHLRK